MSLRRLPLPGWVLAISMVAFVVTWIVAPRSVLSGQTELPGSASPEVVVKLPPRTSTGPPPVQKLPPGPFRDLTDMPNDPVYSPGAAWKVAFTFDDGPHHLHTRRLLQILAHHKVTATFFINGYWLDDRYKKGAKNRQVLMEAHRLGHSIGNHTLDHVKLATLSEEEQTHQIVANHRLIEAATGRAPALFRPPYAVMTEHSRAVLARLGYVEARWNATAPDHEVHDPEAIRDTVMTWLRSYQGGIVMLHDRNRWSVEAARLILEALHRDNCRRLRRGKPTYRVVSLDSLLRPPPLSWARSGAGERERHLEHLEQLRRSCN